MELLKLQDMKKLEKEIMRNTFIEEDLKSITDSNLPWEKLEGKNILITGANGFIPAYLVETILYLNEKRLKNKAKVFALVRNKEKALKRFAFYKNRTDLVFIVQDVIEPINLKEDIHFIIHAASQASPKYFATDPVGTMNANVIGIYNLLKYAKNRDIESFLFFSSGEVYGNIEISETKINESMYGYLDPMDVRSCYAEGKRAGETMCISYHKQFGVPVKIVRPFHTYGPGMRLDDGRVFADFVSNIVNYQDIKMKSDGSAIRSFCYLSDATSGFMTVLLKGDDAQAYNVTNPTATTRIYDLAKTLVELFPERKLKVLRVNEQDRTGYLRSNIYGFIPDISKLMKLGWTPKISIEEGFRRTIMSFL